MMMSQRNDLFPGSIALAAQRAQRETDCLACVTLAQWALESDFGKRLTGANNPFGIKQYEGSPYTSTICRTQEEINGSMVTIEAAFVNFPNIELAFNFHGRLIVSPHNIYSEAYPYRKDWRRFIIMMAKHYASDEFYARKLTTIVEEYNLQDFNLSGT